MSNGPRVQMRRYLRSFVAWCRTLSDDDMRQVISFLQTLRHAHYVGQDKRDESPETPPADESVHQGEPKPPDANCITTADGGCIGGEAAGLERCMHDPQEKPDGPAH